MLNWKIRYAKIIQRYPALQDLDNSILEIGCGPYGIAFQLRRPVQGVERVPTDPQTPWLKIDAGSVLHLPYSSESFDYVLCVDVLEHLAQEDRRQAIMEVVRAAKKCAIISCPFKYPAEEGEKALASWFGRRFGGHPGWLQEHLANGLPHLGEILSDVVETGYQFEVFPNEGMLQHYAGILLDSEFPFSRVLLELHNRKIVSEPPIEASEWDLPYSYVISIGKDQVRNRIHKVIESIEQKQPESCVKIYVVCDKKELAGDFGGLSSILSGEAALAADGKCLTDLLPNGQQLQCDRWSELSAIYRIWRSGPVSDIVGFCRYGRFFDFSGNNTSSHSTRIKSDVLPVLLDEFIEEGLLDRCLENGVIITRPHQLGNSGFNQYACSYNAGDLCRVVSLISKNAPELTPYLGNLFFGESFYAHNMFVMKWELFDQLCKVWFGILLDFESCVPPRLATPRQNRDICLLGERVFDVWVRYAVKELDVRLLETPMYCVVECA